MIMVILLPPLFQHIPSGQKCVLLGLFSSTKKKSSGWDIRRQAIPKHMCKVATVKMTFSKAFSV